MIFILPPTTPSSVYSLDNVETEGLDTEPDSVFTFADKIRSIDAIGGTVFVSAGRAGTRILRNGVEIGKIDSPDAHSCVLWNNTACLADYKEGLFFYDISDPENPVQTAGLELENCKFSALTGSLLAVSASGGIHIIKLSESGAPEKMSVIETYYAEAFTAKG